MAGGLAGLLAAYAFDMIFTLQRPILSVVASMVRDWVPTHAHEVVEKYVGLHDRDLFLLLLVVAGSAVCAGAGVAARTRWWMPTLVFSALGAVAVIAVLTQTAGGVRHLLPVGIGWVAAHAVFWLLAWLIRREATAAAQPESEAGLAHLRASRRALLAAAGTLTVAGVAGGLVAQSIGTGRRSTAGVRRLVRLPALTRGEVPLGAQSAVEGAASWRTVNADFFVRTTALRTPAIDPDQWTLRVHGLVAQPLTLTYADLVQLPVTEQWSTLVCAQGTTASPIAGNAWWTGVRVRDVLNWAGIGPGAVDVVQRSEDGWECRTALATMLEPRALLAFGMNGEVLPTEHGFPVRTVVPGTLGDVSACKWLVDLEVVGAEPRPEDSPDDTAGDQPSDPAGEQSGQLGPQPPDAVTVPWTVRFDQVLAGSADARPEPVRVVGTVWGPDSAHASVQLRVDEGLWQPVRLLPLRPAEQAALPPSVWRQFVEAITLEPGEHSLELRVTGSGWTGEPVSAEVMVPVGLAD